MKVKIEFGKIIPLNEENGSLLNKFIQKYNNSNKVFDLYFEEESDVITDAQKRLYTAIVLKVVEETGNDFETVDVHLKQLLPKMERLNILNEVEYYTLSFDSLQKYEFTLFLEKVLLYINEFFNIKMSLEYEGMRTNIVIK